MHDMFSQHINYVLLPLVGFVTYIVLFIYSYKEEIDRLIGQNQYDPSKQELLTLKGNKISKEIK